MWDVLWYPTHAFVIIPNNNIILHSIRGGEGGIRTHGTGEPYT